MVGLYYNNSRRSEKILREIRDRKKLKSALRSEIGYQKVTHPNDALQRKHMYKINFISTNKFIENLYILLYISDVSLHISMVQFPSEEAVYQKLISENPQSLNSSSDQSLYFYYYNQPLLAW